MQYSLNKDLQHLKWKPPRWWISSPDCRVAMDKQQTQYQLIPKWKWKMCTNYWKFPNRSVQTFGFVYHDTNGQNHGPVWKIQSFFLSGICTVIFWQDYCGKGNLRKFYWNMAGRRVQIGNVSLFIVKKDYSYLCMWDDIKLAGKKHNIDPMWKVLNKEVEFGRTNIFLGSCILRLHSTSMRSKPRYCGQLQNHVWISNFCGGIRKITITSKSSYFFMVFWHGWSCKEVCGTRLWVGKQDESTTLQSMHSMHRWPPLQRRNEICWRNVTCMLSNCSEMLTFGKNWTTWYFMVSKQARTIHQKMDQGLWETLESIDYKDSLNLWI